MVGIDELKDVLKFAAALGNGVGKSMEDKKFTWTDYPNFIDAVIKLPAAVSGIEQVPAEVSDIDDAEMIELKLFVQSEFQIPQKDTEAFIERSFGLVVELWDFVNDYFISKSEPLET